VRGAGDRLVQRSKHIRLDDSKDFAAAGTMSGSVHEGV
jgi:hypothetical protein